MNQATHREAKAKMYSHCTRCGKPKEIPIHVAARRPPSAGRGKSTPSKSYVDPAVYASDPYCSRACCEADLLEPEPEKPAVSRPSPLSCKRGHPWSEVSERIDHRGQRACRICDAQRKRVKRAEKAAT